MALIRRLADGRPQSCYAVIALRNYGTRLESKQWKQKPNRKSRLGIILTEDVHNLGVKGQLVEVKHGYGRNHLIPQKKAVYATHYNIEELNAFKVEKGGTQMRETEFITRFLQDKELTVRVLPSTTVVTEREISRAFRQCLQLHIPLDCIELERPITGGGGSVMVRMSEDTLVNVPVSVDTSLTTKEQRKLDKRKTFLSKLNMESE